MAESGGVSGILGGDAETPNLIEVQTEHLHEQRAVSLQLLKLKRIGALIMIRDAIADHGLVVEAFSVPPDMVRDGLTGQVVATRFLDKLQAMQTATASDRRPRTLLMRSGAWGDALAHQGEKKAAIAKFDEALEYAPNLKELKAAREAVAKRKS